GYGWGDHLLPGGGAVLRRRRVLPTGAGVLHLRRWGRIDVLPARGSLLRGRRLLPAGSLLYPRRRHPDLLPRERDLLFRGRLLPRRRGVLRRWRVLPAGAGVLHARRRSDLVLSPRPAVLSGRLPRSGKLSDRSRPLRWLRRRVPGGSGLPGWPVRLSRW